MVNIFLAVIRRCKQFRYSQRQEEAWHETRIIFSDRTGPIGVG